MRRTVAVCLVLLAGCTSPAASRSTPSAPQEIAAALSMAVPRAVHTATALTDGRVLIAGGCVRDGCEGTPDGGRSELFDPRTRTFAPGPTDRFSAAAPMPQPRATHAAVLLGDGRVLIAGGQSGRTTLLDTALTYDPATNAWEKVGSLDAAKYKVALAPLPDGGALLVGGQTSDDRAARLARTERFDVRTRMFTPGPTMAEPRFKISEAVVALADGRVVIAGGVGVEVYEDSVLRSLAPAAGGERLFPAVAALPDGGVLVTGGYDNFTRVTASAFVVRG
jgi:hypothetical protein